MSSNATPNNPSILISLARAIHGGQVTHAASVGLLRHLAPVMDAAIKLLVGDDAAEPGTAANKGSQLVYRSCVTATGEAESALGAFSEGGRRRR